MKGTKPSSGLVTIKDNRVNLRSVKLNGKKYYSYATLVSDADNNGEVSIGDKYTYKVNEIDAFNFYVLSFNDDNTANLIMDRNICNDGTVNYTSANNYCRYKWHAGVNDNNYGPDTAMQELYNGTKNWTNVPDMNLNYIDENNADTNHGYTSIITYDKVINITGKLGAGITTIQIIDEYLKARLPMQYEVIDAGCTTSAGSCPTWLMENMKYYNISNDKYSMNNNNEAYKNINGYWLLSSHPSCYNAGKIIYYHGNVNYDNTNAVNYAIRPVITVSIDELS